MGKLGVTLGGYAAALVLGWLLLEARQDVGEALEACNTRVETARAEAERAGREASDAAHSRRIAELERMLLSESEARRRAQATTAAAEADARTAQQKVQRLLLEAANNETATLEQVCLNTGFDAATLDAIRLQ